MSSNKKKAASALQPRNQSSPFGTLSNTKHSTSYQPNYFDGQQDILNTAPRNEANLLSSYLPNMTNQYTGALGSLNNFMSSLTPDHLVNPDIYKAMYGLQSQPLLTQYHQDINNLNDELASKNLTGGSYDALAHGKLNQNLDLGLGQAANQAEIAGLGATGDYAGWLGNNAQLQGQGTQQLGNLANNYQALHTNLEQELMDPFKSYTSYQSAVNPLQLATASYLGQPSVGYQMLQGAGTNFANSFGSSLGSGLGKVIFPGGSPAGGASASDIGGLLGSSGQMLASSAPGVFMP